MSNLCGVKGQFNDYIQARDEGNSPIFFHAILQLLFIDKNVRNN